MKLVKKDNEYYLLSNDGLQTRDWALRPDDVILRMTDTDMIDYLDSESTATRKIIASTKKLDDLPFINKSNIESIIPGNADLNKMAEMRYGSSPQGAKCRAKWVDGYDQCLEDNAEKKYTKEDIEKAWLNGFLSDDAKLRSEFIQSLNKPKTEWRAEVEMGLYPHPDTKFINDGKTYPIETIEKPKVIEGFINVLSIK
jgi:hypothetical protein